MNIRQLTEHAVDLDIEHGATTPVFAQREDGLLYTLKDVIVDWGEEHDDMNPTGPIIIIKVEEV